mmetsp:Transcript_28718/g.64168  ORF Transcript_28718/g.64168 Transcript_28718/m.64168 type:complete len:395 (+) Transcript_28718:35-1219(+)
MTKFHSKAGISLAQLLLLLFFGLIEHAEQAAESRTCSELEVPLVDLEAKDGVQEATAAACAEFGVFRPVGHGISDEDISRALVAHRRLFALPQPEKETVPIQPGGFTRGYVALGVESGTKNRLECKEAFSYGMDWEPDPRGANALQGPNAWPASLDPVSRHSLLRFFNESARVSKQVAMGLADALGLQNSESIAELCEGGESISLMRAFRYFPESHGSCQDGAAASVERIGSSPHTDWGFLTLILGDGGSGLQIYRGGQWLELDFEARKNPIVICGDYLKLATADRFTSPFHQVILPQSGQERASFVFFYYPRFDANFGEAARNGEALAHLSISDGPEAAHEPESDRGQHGEYNTMLDIARGDPTALDAPFGEYILRKWGGVFQSTQEQAPLGG